MSNSTPFQANARILILIDDYEQSEKDYYKSVSKKSLYQLTSYTNISSTVSVEGSGNITVSFNDRDFRFWRKLNYEEAFYKDIGSLTVPDARGSNKNLLETFGYSTVEVNYFKSILKTLSEKNIDIYKALSEISKTGFLSPIVCPQNLIWVHYLGRDGVWYSGFSGIITSIEINHEPSQTETYKIIGKTPDRLFEYSYVKTGLGNISEKPVTELEVLNSQDNKNSYGFTNNFGFKNTAEVITEALLACNKFFKVEYNKNAVGGDARYFKVKNIFDFGAETNNKTKDIYGKERFIYEKESGVSVENSNDWKIKTWNYDEGLKVSELYPGEELTGESDKSWLKVKISKDFTDNSTGLTKPFQNLVRTNMQLFNTEKMSVKDIINTVKKSAFCLTYFDTDGSFKVERPYFDISFKGFTKYPKSGNIVVDENNTAYVVNTPEIEQMDNLTLNSSVPDDYNLNYVISKKDISYISSSYVENESGYITRTQVSSKFDFVNPEENTSKMVWTAKSESSPKMIGKFGARDVELDTIVHPDFFKSENAVQTLSSYAMCMKHLLSCQAKIFTLVLDQRPDIQLNRKIYFLDLGLAFVTKVISNNFSPKEGRLTTTIQGYYVHNIGFPLINPYFWRIYQAKESDVGAGIVIKKVEDVSVAKEIIRKDKTGKVVVNDAIFDEGETWENIKAVINQVHNSAELDGRLNVNWDKESLKGLVWRFDDAQGEENELTRQAFGEPNHDYLYYIWIDKGINMWAKFPCWGGNPYHVPSNLKSGSIYARLSWGGYYFSKDSGDKISITGSKDKVNILGCERFYIDTIGSDGKLKTKKIASSDYKDYTIFIGDNYVDTNYMEGNSIDLKTAQIYVSGSGKIFKDVDGKSEEVTKSIKYDDFYKVTKNPNLSIYVKDWYGEPEVKPKDDKPKDKISDKITLEYIEKILVTLSLIIKNNSEGKKLLEQSKLSLQAYKKTVRIGMKDTYNSYNKIASRFFENNQSFDTVKSLFNKTKDGNIWGAKYNEYYQVGRGLINQDIVDSAPIGLLNLPYTIYDEKTRLSISKYDSIKPNISLQETFISKYINTIYNIYSSKKNNFIKLFNYNYDNLKIPILITDKDIKNSEDINPFPIGLYRMQPSVIIALIHLSIINQDNYDWSNKTIIYETLTDLQNSFWSDEISSDLRYFLGGNKNFNILDNVDIKKINEKITGTSIDPYSQTNNINRDSGSYPHAYFKKRMSITRDGEDIVGTNRDDIDNLSKGGHFLYTAFGQDGYGYNLKNLIVSARLFSKIIL